MVMQFPSDRSLDKAPASRCELPSVAASNVVDPDVPDEVSSAASSSLWGTFVVLVEDDQGAREALEEQLKAWGVQFCSGITGDDVLPKLLSMEQRVDAILADLRLPGRLDGIA